MPVAVDHRRVDRSMPLHVVLHSREGFRTFRYKDVS